MLYSQINLEYFSITKQAATNQCNIAFSFFLSILTPVCFDNNGPGLSLSCAIVTTASWRSSICTVRFVLEYFSGKSCIFHQLLEKSKAPLSLFPLPTLKFSRKLNLNVNMYLLPSPLFHSLAENVFHFHTYNFHTQVFSHLGHVNRTAEELCTCPTVI